MLCKWEELPVELQNPSVRPYYDRLDTHRKQLLLKRIFDICIDRRSESLKFPRTRHCYIIPQ